MITIRLFARLREQLGCSALELPMPPAPATVAALGPLLAERGEQWRALLEGEEILVAINQEMADRQSPLQSGDEVAFFPPVTGG